MKTEQSAISAVNKQIFSSSQVAKKFIQSLLYLTMLFGYGIANASSNPANFNLNVKEKLTNSTNSTFPNLGNNFSNFLVGSGSSIPTLMWTKQNGAVNCCGYGGQTFAYGVSADNNGNGNAYVVGWTGVGLSGQTQHGYMDYFIAKHDSNGNLTWVRQVGATNGYSQALGVNVDSNDNTYVVGWTTVGISGQTQTGYTDYFIAKYDANGNLIWTRQFGINGTTSSDWIEDTANGVSVDNNGNIYVVGGISQTNVADYFIDKYDYNGNLIWTEKVKGTSCILTLLGVSEDNNGNIYAVGSTGSGINGQKQHGQTDYFIVKYDQFGNLIWTKQVGASSGNVGGNTYGYGINADNYGNIYITGSTDVGISGQVQNGFNDYFIARYDLNGNLIWTTQVGAYDGTTVGNGISADNYGNIYVAGQTDIGISGQKQNGVLDYFIAQYDQFGNLLWTEQVGAENGKTSANGVSGDSIGNIYVAGQTNIGISGQKQNGTNDYFIARWTN